MPLSKSLATRLFIANDLPVPGPAMTLMRAFVDAAISQANDFGEILSDQAIDTLVYSYFGFAVRAREADAMASEYN